MDEWVSAYETKIEGCAKNEVFHVGMEDNKNTAKMGSEYGMGTSMDTDTRGEEKKKKWYCWQETRGDEWDGILDDKRQWRLRRDGRWI